MIDRKGKLRRFNRLINHRCLNFLPLVHCEEEVARCRWGEGKTGWRDLKFMSVSGIDNVNPLRWRLPCKGLWCTWARAQGCGSLGKDQFEVGRGILRLRVHATGSLAEQSTVIHCPVVEEVSMATQSPRPEIGKPQRRGYCIFNGSHQYKNSDSPSLIRQSIHSHFPFHSLSPLGRVRPLHLSTRPIDARTSSPQCPTLVSKAHRPIHLLTVHRCQIGSSLPA